MADLELHVSTDGAQKVARLKLSRADGEHLGANEIRRAEPANAEDLLQRLGRFLGVEVLGEQITRVLRWSRCATRSGTNTPAVWP